MSTPRDKIIKTSNIIFSEADMSNSGLVFSIEEFSVFDGPGIRTSVFLMGCPLRCEWCHNPEGQSFRNSIVRSPNGCIDCKSCLKHAEEKDGRLQFTEKSIAMCPQNLLRYCAEEYTPERLCEKLLKNAAILNSAGGGVTFSGGEPTASGEFLIECLTLLEGKVNRAIQSCGYCKGELWKRVLDNSDYFLFDVKLINDALHKRYTGVSNEPILENFKALVHSGKDFVIRTPLIPTVTDTVENITDIAKLLSKNGVKYIELLPYNKMAGSKYRLAGMTYSPSFDTELSPEARTEIFESFGIKSKIV